jgi:ATP phosphoribosyltransferase
MNDARDRLRIAVQKSGRLTEPSLALLRQCGLSFRQGRDRLFCHGEGMPVDLLLVRDDDIPGLIEQGVCDLGIVGRNVLAEYQGGPEAQAAPPRVAERQSLGFGQCRLALAVPQERAYQGLTDLQGLRIATTYPRLLAQFLAREGIRAEIVALSGSVEIAPRLGTADLICDLVSSGATLAANHLREVAALLESEATLVSSAREPADARGEIQDMLLRRIEGVLAVRESKLVLLRAPRARLAAIVKLLPIGVTPELTAVEGDADEVALQALCPRAVSWPELEAMRRAGARALLVLPVDKVLA